MLHSQPIQYQHAPESIRPIYREIQEVFSIETVPTFFQYLANYPQYLAFIWNKMKRNLNSERFYTISLDIKKFAALTVSDFLVSSTLEQYTSSLTDQEKSSIAHTVIKLEQLNIQLMLLTIDLRESMKNISIGIQQITANIRPTGHNPGKQSTHSEYHQSEIETSMQLLAPLLGDNSMIISSYPTFFAYIAEEMIQLQKEELYLEKRVLLEQQALTEITKFVEPLGCSYQEFRKLTEGEMYIEDLVYVITDLFPSQLPNLVLATAFMEYMLYKKEASLQNV